MEASPSNPLITAIDNKDHQFIDELLSVISQESINEAFYYLVTNGDINTLKNSYFLNFISDSNILSDGIKIAIQNDDLEIVKYLFSRYYPTSIAEFIQFIKSKEILEYVLSQYSQIEQANGFYLSVYYGNLLAYNYFKSINTTGRINFLRVLLGSVQGAKDKIKGDQLKIIDDILTNSIDLSKLTLYLSTVYPEISNLKVDINDYFDLLRKVYFSREITNNGEVRNVQIPFLSNVLKSMFPLLDIHKVLISKNISSKEEMYSYLTQLAENYIAENLPKTEEYQLAKKKMSGDPSKALRDILIERISKADASNFNTLLQKVEKYYDFDGIREVNLKEAKKVLISVVPNLIFMEIQDILS